MSTVNSVPTIQSLILAATGKTGASKIVSDQPKSADNDSSASISSAGSAYADYIKVIEQKESGRTLRQMALEDPNNPQWAQAVDVAVDENMLGGPIGGLVSLVGTTMPNAPIKYSSGEPVTKASQAYYEKQAAIYMGQLRDFVGTEKAQGTPPGEIYAGILDLQAKQPDAFRAMMMWTPAAPPHSIERATNPTGAPQQYLDAGGQVVKT